MSNEYKNHEFCIAVNCPGMRTNIDGEYDYCSYSTKHCLKTAKEFHKWLKKERYVIFKPESKDELVLPFTLKIY